MQKLDAKRRVALLDIDLTLLCADKNRQDAYNHSLLDALKKQGITDVYLFTDMKFGAGDIDARKSVIKFLEDAGITVHGCITPLDYFWDFEQQDELKTMVDELMQTDICMREGAQKNLYKIAALIDKYPAITAWLKKEKYPPICQAYNDGKDKEEAQLEVLRLKSIYCKMAIDLVTLYKKLKSSKYLMFMQFLEHKPDWITECFVFDDMLENLDAVNECKLEGFPIHTIHGVFNHKGDTFVENFFRYIKMQTVLDDIVVVAFKNVKLKQVQKDGKLLGQIFKKEFDYEEQNTLAQNLLDQIVRCDRDFDEKWKLILNHFSQIAKDMFGYKLTEFDTEILNGIAADKDVCAKLGVTTYKNPDDLLKRLLADSTPNSLDTEVKSLHSSMEIGLRLSRNRSSSFSKRKMKASSQDSTNKLDDLKEPLPKSSSAGSLNKL